MCHDEQQFYTITAWTNRKTYLVIIKEEIIPYNYVLITSHFHH